MARPRSELSQILHRILGNNNVYYAPPSGYELNYPAIIYRMTRINPRHADNTKFVNHNEYTVTLITEEEDSELVTDLFMGLMYCTFNTSQCIDGLYHYVFTVNF